MNHDGVDSLLSEFGQLIGIAELEFDEDGLCNFTINDENPITIRRDDVRQCITLLGKVADTLPEQINRTLLTDMLALGLSPLRHEEIGLGLEENSGQLLIHQSLLLSEIHPSQLVERFGAFIETQTLWIKRLVNECSHC